MKKVLIMMLVLLITSLMLYGEEDKPVKIIYQVCDHEGCVKAVNIVSYKEDTNCVVFDRVLLEIGDSYVGEYDVKCDDNLMIVENDKFLRL